jgi:uncharacterized protein
MRKFLTLLLLIVLSVACQSGSRQADPLKSVQLLTPKGEPILTTLAITEPDQVQGLSGVKPQDFEDNQGMLFFYLEEGDRAFWMPDTYFDLDLFYLDRDLKVIDIIRKLPHYIGRANPHLIPRARTVWARHVLEMKSTSPLAASMKIGDALSWKSSLTLQETEAEARKLTQR